MEEWRKNAPPITPEEAHLNLPHLQRLIYNPNYYTPNEEKLNIGDDIVIGQYASDLNGSPNIRWIETKVKGIPLANYYSGYVTCRKRKLIKEERKKKIENLNKINNERI